MPAEGELIVKARGRQSLGGAPVIEPALNVAQLTRPALVLAGLRNRDGLEVLRKLCDALAREGLIAHASQFFSTAMNREITCNTAVAPEWAIPHVRSSHCVQLCLAVATCPFGVNWFGTAGVRAVFLFGVPDQEAMTYMFAVSALARATMVQEAEHLAEIGRAQDHETLLGLLRTIPIKPPAASPGPIVN